MAQTDPTPAAANSRHFRWRRLVQFRLRTVLIVMAFVAIGLRWCSHKARQQRLAVEALERAEAWCSYDFQRDPRAFQIDPRWDDGGPKTPPYLPEWLINMVGLDYFASVTSMNTLNTQFSDAQLVHLHGMSAIRQLGLGSTQVTDAGMEKLCHLTALKELDLGNTTISDIGANHLKGLTGLQKLDIRNTLVTDAGIDALQTLTALKQLELYNTKVTRAAVERLRHKLPDCEIQWYPPDATRNTFSKANGQF